MVPFRALCLQPKIIGVIDWNDKPVHFIIEIFELALCGAVDHLANFVGAEPKSLVFVSNSTDGVNAVSRSLSFGSG